MRLSQSAGGDQVKKVFLNQNKKFRFTPGDLESLWKALGRSIVHFDINFRKITVITRGTHEAGRLETGG